MRGESIIILPFSPSLFTAAILFLRKKKTIKKTAPKAMNPANTELTMMPTVKKPWRRQGSYFKTPSNRLLFSKQL